MVSRKVKYKDTVNEYYICSGYNRGRECTRHSIKVDVLNEIVFKYRNEMAKAVDLIKGELETNADAEPVGGTTAPLKEVS